MARHYGTAGLPARPRKPRDKAKVEACVGIVERWLLGRLPSGAFALTEPPTAMPRPEG
jgi:transposase